MKWAKSMHAWDLTPRQAIELQCELATRVRLCCPTVRIRYIAGVDCAFTRDGKACLAAAVLWDREQQEMVASESAEAALHFPYIPGLLSFREAPAILNALEKLPRSSDLLMCDGHGIAHPRRFGLACHLGVLCDIPAIGCAKARLIGEPDGVVGEERGARVWLWDKGDIIGVVLRTRRAVKPVFVSVGHQIDIETAVELVLESAPRYRLPEPTRRADRQVAEAKRAL